MLRLPHSRLLASAILTSQLALGGCQGAEKAKSHDFHPDFTTLLKLPGSETSARAQKKETPTRSILELGEEESLGEQVTRGARIRATVNGEAILEEEVVAAAIQPLMQARTEEEKAEILNAKLQEIIERELLMQDAIARLSKKSGMRFFRELEKIADREFDKQWLYKLMQANKVSDVQVFTRMLKDQGIPIELIRRQWVRNFIAMEYLRSRIDPQLNKIGHLEIVEYYDKHPDQFKVEDKVVWQNIFIANARHPSPEAARQFAESLIARIRQGEDFVRLAKQFDNGDSSLRENALGLGNKRGEIQPVEAEEILFQLKEGEVGPLIANETGYHIVRVLKRTYAGLMPFDDKVQRLIGETLKNKAFQLEMRKIVNELKRHAIIEIATDIR